MLAVQLPHARAVVEVQRASTAASLTLRAIDVALRDSKGPTAMSTFLGRVCVYERVSSWLVFS